MNETEFHDKFNEFEDVEIIDTYTTQIIQQARELEDLMNTVPYETLTELQKLELKLFAQDYLQAMNNDCPYINQEVSVTGDVITGTYDVVTDQYSVAKVTHGNHHVVAKGFLPLLREEPHGSGKNKYRIGHHFLSEVLEPRVSGVPLVDSIPRLYSFAPVGTVDIVADVPEARHAGILYKTIPDVIDSVNYEIGQAKNESDALCRLRRVVVEDAIAIPEEVINSLLNYTYDCLNMDEVVPYVAHFRGAVYQGAPGKDGGLAFAHYDNSARPVLVLPMELRLAPYPKKVNGLYEIGDNDHFMVKLRLIGEKNGDAERIILAPVRNIKSMQSLRNIDAGSQSNTWYRS